MEDLQSSLCKDVFIKAEGEVVVVHSLVLVQEQRLADIAVQLEML